MKITDWIKTNPKKVGIGIGVVLLILVISHYCGPSMVPEPEAETTVEQAE